MGHGARVLIERLRMRQSNVKALGQHFLNNEEVLDETMKLAKVSSDDHVVEIGPGPGVLTERLMETGCSLTTIELDSGICEYLRDTFPKINLIEGDALELAVLLEPLDAGDGAAVGEGGAGNGGSLERLGSAACDDAATGYDGASYDSAPSSARASTRRFMFMSSTRALLLLLLLQ